MFSTFIFVYFETIIGCAVIGHSIFLLYIVQRQYISSTIFIVLDHSVSLRSSIFFTVVIPEFCMMDILEKLLVNEYIYSGLTVQ